jgi:hypothetical protein
VNTPDHYDAKLLEVLNRHPTLKHRVEALADIVADSDGDLVRADESERRVIEEVRRLGGEVLHGWAEGRIARTGEQAAAPETIRGIVEGHAQALLGQQQAEQPAWPAVPGEAQLVAEVDGGMVPIAVTDLPRQRRRGQALCAGAIGVAAHPAIAPEGQPARYRPRGAGTLCRAR